MSAQQLRISPNPSGWRRGHKPWSERDSFHSSTKEEALQRGREISQNQNLELIRQRQDWTIQGRNSYGNDPRSSKG